MRGYLLSNKPDARLGVFSQNDDAGTDYVRGLKDGLGAKAAQLIVKELTLRDHRLDDRFPGGVAEGLPASTRCSSMTTPKFGAQTMRKIAELGWKPLTYLSAVSTSIKTVLEPAGLENSEGLITALAIKRPEDPRWENEKDVQGLQGVSQAMVSVGKSWLTAATSPDIMAAFVTVRILELCGNNLTRENLLKQATNLTDLAAPLLLPGITITTTPQRRYRHSGRCRLPGSTAPPGSPKGRCSVHIEPNSESNP